MKIKTLIKILSTAPNKDKNIWIDGNNKEFTTDIGYSFDDNNDI